MPSPDPHAVLADGTVTLHHGDSRDILAALPDCSVDSIVTDPPYELGFMGKAWDASGIAYNVDLWREALRVLKPGGHLLAFGGTRTYHRMAVAIEDAGFEIRDSIHWVYGSGFPKSLDVSKAIDKAAGAEREVVGVKPYTNPDVRGDAYGSNPDRERLPATITAPATDAARTWHGWGTALKPAHEPIVLARKPIRGTVAANVLEHGTGALNIDGCRVGSDKVVTHHTERPAGDSVVGRGARATGEVTEHAGRWPANVIHDGSDDVLAHFPTTSTWAAKNPKQPDEYVNRSMFGVGGQGFGPADSGSAARFFAALGHDELDAASFLYCAKPSKTERNAGLDDLDEQAGGSLEGGNDKRRGDRPQLQPTKNHHPTVKPLALMRWLIRLVTPPGGTVLEPFAGSGTTLAAATLEGRHAIGIELTADYLPIIEGRVTWAHQHRPAEPEPEPSLFDPETAL